MGKMRIYKPHEPVRLRGRETDTALSIQPNVKRCPRWLFDQYRRNLPIYAFHNKNAAATFVNVRWSQNLNAYVGVYQRNKFRIGNPENQWVGEYVWLYRAGLWTEIQQDPSWDVRDRHIGWYDA